MGRSGCVTVGNRSRKGVAASARARVLEVLGAVALVTLLAQGSKYHGRANASFRSDAGDVQLGASGDVRLSTQGLAVDIAGSASGALPPGSLRTLRDAWGIVLDDVRLGAFVDESPADLIIDDLHTTPEGPMHATARATLRSRDEIIDGVLDFTLSRAPAGIVLSLRSKSASAHKLSIVLTMAPKAALPFVGGTGIFADSGEADGPFVVFDGEHRALALGSETGDVHFRLAPSATSEASPKPALAVTIRSPARDAGQPTTLFITVAPEIGLATEAAARLRHESVRRLSGRVLGGEIGGVDVWGIGSSGHVTAHARTGPDGRFSLVVPALDLGFYATTAQMRASPIVSRRADDDGELELTLLPGGEVRVRVVDFDTNQPLTSRLIVHGVPPTADPNFGPDYRASGAGPLMDALHGDAVMTLPSGRYRLLATHGPEYTIDEQPLDIAPGSTRVALLALRRVVDVPGAVGCDFHVHARPSFDSPVLPEDRVLSLVSAGIRFAVPTEHNIVGHYGPAVEALNLSRELSHVPGVEVTTVRPFLGHFNVFPYAGPEVPPFRKTTLRQIFAKARAGDASRVIQVNHPRLWKHIGYFDLAGLDTKTGHAEREFRDDFDTLEVFNGFDAANRARVESVMMDWLRLLEHGHRFVATGDSDSHRIQYQWAGYPRTYVTLPPEGGNVESGPIDGAMLIASLKAGHAFVTNGPIIEADIDGHGPGDTVVLQTSQAQVRVRVRAAPWIDVDEVELFVGTQSAARRPIASRPGRTGVPNGALDDVRRQMIRFDSEFEVAIRPPDGFVVVVVRGSRRLDDVLPYMATQPLAFTNPIWVRHE